MLRITFGIRHNKQLTHYVFYFDSSKITFSIGLVDRVFNFRSKSLYSVNVDQDEQFLQCGQYPAHTVMLAGQSLHALINRQMTSLWATLLNDSKSYGSIDRASVYIGLVTNCL